LVFTLVVGKLYLRAKAGTMADGAPSKYTARPNFKDASLLCARVTGQVTTFILPSVAKNCVPLWLKKMLLDVIAFIKKK